MSVSNFQNLHTAVIVDSMFMQIFATIALVAMFIIVMIVANQAAMVGVVHACVFGVAITNVILAVKSFPRTLVTHVPKAVNLAGNH